MEKYRQIALDFAMKLSNSWDIKGVQFNRMLNGDRLYDIIYKEEKIIGRIHYIRVKKNGSADLVFEDFL